MELVDEQMTEYHFRDHDLLLLVLLDRNTTPVVVDRDLVLFPVDANLDCIHGRIVNLGQG